MDHRLTVYLLVFYFSSVRSQMFAEESPYLSVRIMDVRLNQWKADSLNVLERAVDSELKYTDERKGIQCKTIKFEQEAGYPKQEGRFLDLSIQGLCTDPDGNVHFVEKDLITKAIIREKDQVNAAVNGIIFRLGNVQIYSRNRNQLNLIIIPVSIGFVVFLFVFTFVLRQIRYQQKRKHIIAELQKKRDLNQKKNQTLPNIDPLANDKQRLLNSDPTVVGNVSHTTGSSKEFTNDQYTNVNRTNTVHAVNSRIYGRDDEDSPPPIPSKENRAPYYKREDEIPLHPKTSWNSSRERINFVNDREFRFTPNHNHFQHDAQNIPMIPMQEHQPRVVVRSIRDDSNFPILFHQQQESPASFVTIPVHIEHSAPHSRFTSSPYHSDPYYPNHS